MLYSFEADCLVPADMQFVMQGAPTNCCPEKMSEAARRSLSGEAMSCPIISVFVYAYFLNPLGGWFVQHRPRDEGTHPWDHLLHKSQHVCVVPLATQSNRLAFSVGWHAGFALLEALLTQQPRFILCTCAWCWLATVARARSVHCSLTSTTDAHLLLGALADQEPICVDFNFHEIGLQYPSHSRRVCCCHGTEHNERSRIVSCRSSIAPTDAHGLCNRLDELLHRFTDNV